MSNVVELHPSRGVDIAIQLNDGEGTIRGEINLLDGPETIRMLIETVLDEVDKIDNEVVKLALLEFHLAVIDRAKERIIDDLRRTITEG